MKKNIKSALKLLLFFAFTIFFASISLAENEEVIKPPKDLVSVIGKTITFTDPTLNPRGDTWFLPITGAVKYTQSEATGVNFYVPCGIEYYSKEISQICYSESTTGIKWFITFYENTEKIISPNYHKIKDYKNLREEEIKVISIE